jgi:hypothetical protein
MAVGSYLRVSVDAVVAELVVVLVEEGCCSPLQTYRVSGSAAPSVPSPKTNNPPNTPQEKCRVEIGTFDSPPTQS